MIRRIKYNVGKEKGITPAKRQWAGMQFEDNATEVIFDISALGIENALYRVDFNSAGAGYQPSESLTADGGIIKRLIPKVVTQYGGEAQVTAVITVLDESGNETGVCYSYPAVIYFTDVEKDADGSSTVEENISAAEASALAAASRAEQAANTDRINAAASSLNTLISNLSNSDLSEETKRSYVLSYVNQHGTSDALYSVLNQHGMLITGTGAIFNRNDLYLGETERQARAVVSAAFNNKRFSLEKKQAYFVHYVEKYGMPEEEVLNNIFIGTSKITKEQLLEAL